MSLSEAVILAGGKGRRLQPYTTETPKPLVPIGDRPIIEYVLRSLARHGVQKIHMAVNHLAHLISEVVGDGSKYGLAVTYSNEDKPLSTVAPLKLINNLPDEFLVINGDILTDLDYRQLYQNHVDSKAKLTVAVCPRQHQVDYGVLKVDTSNRVVGFQEKPCLEYTVSMGVYIFSRDILSFVPDNQPFGFDNLMMNLLENDESILTYPHDGYWLDIGRLEDYDRANRDIDLIRKLFD